MDGPEGNNRELSWGPHPESIRSLGWCSSEPGVMIPWSGLISAIKFTSSSIFAFEKSAQERMDFLLVRLERPLWPPLRVVTLEGGAR